MPTARDAYHHGDLRRALLEAARRLVERKGAPDVSLRAIAREAGVSPSAPYHHFEDRESLLAAVAAAGFDGLREGMEEAWREHAAKDPLRRLQAAGVAYVEFAVAHPETFRLMFGGIVSDRSRFPELEEASGAAWSALERMLDGDGDDEGTVPPTVALAAWSTVHGLAFLLLEDLVGDEAGSLSTAEVASEVTRVLGLGLRSYGEL